MKKAPARRGLRVEVLRRPLFQRGAEGGSSACRPARLGSALKHGTQACGPTGWCRRRPDRTVSGFQFRCNSQAVFGDMAPSSRALGSLGLLSPVATARRLGSIKLGGGHHAGRSAVRVISRAPNYLPQKRFRTFGSSTFSFLGRHALAHGPRPFGNRRWPSGWELGTNDTKSPICDIVKINLWLTSVRWGASLLKTGNLRCAKLSPLLSP